jgi:aspartate aminotransferase
MKISKRMERLKPSATRAMSDKAAKAKAEGKRVINLTSGEPDFATPDSAKQAAIKAMEQNHTHYTTTAGIVELRKAITGYYKDRHGVSFTEDQILVGVGAKALLFEALGCLVDPGDEVIVFAPAWVSYVEQIDVFDGKVVLVDTSLTDFVPDIAAVKKAISSRTVAIMVNSPHNPTGMVYSREFMKDLCLLAKEHGIVLINDEVYERLTYGTRYYNPLSYAPEAVDNVLTISGVSKAYAMTGWRIGFAAGPKQLISRMAALQGHITSCACSISQWASVGAIAEAQKDVESMVSEYAERLAFVSSTLEKMPYIRVFRPNGAFYMFIDIKPCIGKKYNGQTITDDNTFCEMLLEHGLVGLVAGSAFLMPGYARLSYATSMEALIEAMENMRGFLERLA